MTKLVWTKTNSELWVSGDYQVWVQAKVRECGQMTREYSSMFKDERPWLCDRGTLREAKQACQEHADKLTALDNSASDN